MGDKRTPMAWQHRDINYHHDRYGMEVGRQGPPSMSDRLSHRTDKSWRTQRDSGYHGGHQSNGYPPSRPSYSSGRPATRTHSPDSSSSSSSSSTEDATDQEAQMPPTHLPQPMFGYGGYYPGYLPGPPTTAPYPPSLSQGYPGTLKSAKSVPSIVPMNTWDGEPCPVHGLGPMSLQGPPHPMMPPPHPMMITPGGPMPMPPPPPIPPRKAASIYDLRMLPPPPGPLYGTLPVKHSDDKRSLVGAPPGIPPQLLPPMARPRPLVVSEDGTAEPLPVRSPQDKSGVLSRKMMDSDGLVKKRFCSESGICVGWIVIGVVTTGLILGLLLIFIL